jgi:tetratricopeptide (TPR) repeat protein
MILERHYDDEALIAMLHADNAASDEHLSACAACTETFESYRAIAGVLGEEAVWDLREPSEDGSSRTIAALRAAATHIESDEVHADHLIEEMTKLPRQWWTSTVLSDERYQTTAVARRLVAASEIKIDTAPPEAVDLAAAGVALSEALEEGEFLPQIRGAAYRQHAFALQYVGKFNEALASVERAQQAFEGCAVSEYELARLDIVRAAICAQSQKLDEGLKVSRRAAHVFQQFGDIQRLVSAKIGEANMMIQAHQMRDALSILLDLHRRYEAKIDTYTRAVLLNNIGGCHWNIGQPTEGLQALQLSAELFAEAGNQAESTRVAYNLALLLGANGRRADSKNRLVVIRAEFERLGMPHSAVVAGLDLAEIALLENNFEEVENLCRTAIRQFEAAGIAHSSDALTALTYLREAAEQRRATQEIVWHVKTYIRRLPDEPALLFAPAPLPPS